MNSLNYNIILFTIMSIIALYSSNRYIVIASAIILLIISLVIIYIVDFK